MSCEASFFFYEERYSIESGGMGDRCVGWVSEGFGTDKLEKGCDLVLERLGKLGACT